MANLAPRGQSEDTLETRRNSTSQAGYDNARVAFIIKGMEAVALTRTAKPPSDLHWPHDGLERK